MASICAFCCDKTVAISAECLSLPIVMADRISDKDGSPADCCGGRGGRHRAGRVGKHSSRCWSASVGTGAIGAVGGRGADVEVLGLVPLAVALWRGGHPARGWRHGVGAWRRRDSSHVLVVHHLWVVVAASLRIVVRVRWISKARTVARNWLRHDAWRGVGGRAVPRRSDAAGGGGVVVGAVYDLSSGRLSCRLPLRTSSGTLGSSALADQTVQPRFAPVA